VSPAQSGGRKGFRPDVPEAVPGREPEAAVAEGEGESSEAAAEGEAERESEEGEPEAEESEAESEGGDDEAEEGAEEGRLPASDRSLRRKASEISCGLSAQSLMPASDIL
jgi:hypothetical protein